MVRALFASTLALTFTLAVLTRAAPAQNQEAQAIVQKVEAAPDDAAVLKQAITDLEALLQKVPQDASVHFAHGLLLSRSGRRQEAVTAYDRALELDPTDADAAYNAGVVLAGLGRSDDAIKHWEAAVRADPKHIDAHYNLGQAHYDQKRFAKALEAWQRARALAADDFDITKKVLQCHNALGRGDDAAKARAALLALRKASKDRRVKAMRDFVFDQFDVGGWHVFAFETFEPGGDLYSLYSFRVTDKAGKIAGRVDLESDAGLRERGVQYLLCVGKESSHAALANQWRQLPDYLGELKPLVQKTIAVEFPEPK